jgi:hypothetical protein
MKFNGLSGGEIVTMVFSQFEPRTVWDADRLAGVNSNELPRLYCPSCMQHSTIWLRDEKRTENGVKLPWYCRSCKTWHRRPKQLMRRGEVTGTQSQPGKEHYALLDFDAINVMRAIDVMPRLLKAWTLWVHTDTVTASHQPTIVDEAISAVDRAQLKPDNYHEGVKLYFFAEQLAINERELIRTRRNKYSVERMAAGLGVGTRQLQAGKKWGTLRDIIEKRLRDLEAEMDSAIINALTVQSGAAAHG